MKSFGMPAKPISQLFGELFSTRFSGHFVWPSSTGYARAAREVFQMVKPVRRPCWQHLRAPNTPSLEAVGFLRYASPAVPGHAWKRSGMPGKCPATPGMLGECPEKGSGRSPQPGQGEFTGWEFTGS